LRGNEISDIEQYIKELIEKSLFSIDDSKIFKKTNMETIHYSLAYDEELTTLFSQRPRNNMRSLPEKFNAKLESVDSDNTPKRKS
jgi:hypothetical protein